MANKTVDNSHPDMSPAAYTYNPSMNYSHVATYNHPDKPFRSNSRNMLQDGQPAFNGQCYTRNISHNGQYAAGIADRQKDQSMRNDVRNICPAPNSRKFAWNKGNGTCCDTDYQNSVSTMQISGKNETIDKSRNNTLGSASMYRLQRSQSEGVICKNVMDEDMVATAEDVIDVDQLEDKVADKASKWSNYFSSQSTTASEFVGVGNVARNGSMGQKLMDLGDGQRCKNGNTRNSKVEEDYDGALDSPSHKQKLLEMQQAHKYGQDCY